MSEAKHTPGPWRWEVNRTSNKVALCGGGGMPFDLDVMTFERWGLQSAAPAFWSWAGSPPVAEVRRAHELAAPVPGREHHAEWFADIDHPDARLIAAAPELLAALEAIVSHPSYAAMEDGETGLPCMLIADARAAIAKAKGEAE